MPPPADGDGRDSSDADFADVDGEGVDTGSCADDDEEADGGCRKG